MTDLATAFTISLPPWLLDELPGLPEFIPDPVDRMQLVNRLADRNWREGNGGPFAALVVERDSGRLVSVGVNVVLASGISSAHAEVTALGLAQVGIGAWDLGAPDLPAHELVVNWRPCIQCYGAAMWSGVRSLTIAGDGPELEALTGFDEGPLTADWAAQFEARGIEVHIGIEREAAIDVFRQYEAAAASGQVVVYNARGNDD